MFKQDECHLYHVQEGSSPPTSCSRRVKSTNIMFKKGQVHLHHVREGSSPPTSCSSRVKSTNIMFKKGQVHLHHVQAGPIIVCTALAPSKSGLHSSMSPASGVSLYRLPVVDACAASLLGGMQHCPADNASLIIPLSHEIHMTVMLAPHHFQAGCVTATCGALRDGTSRATADARPHAVR
eukprot:1146627-Pelagomonas_calceolata.AAC.2